MSAMTTLWVIVGCGALAIAYAVWATSTVMASPAGSAKMQEIAAAVREGAQAYLNRQYTTIAGLGGGIFTKGADVGGDLVGKVEAGIPEDDPRNPATIADNVGDNVGDCAGMAADLFESYEVTLVASIILGVAAFKSVHMNPALGLVFPLAARAIGVVASIAGVYAVRAREGETNALKPINSGFLTAGLESSVYAIIAIAVAIAAAIGLGAGNLPLSLYLVALCGMGMLATTGVIVSEDTFGPVADNAAGIAEMSGEFHGPPERIMVSLDAVGNTTKAVTKGFAIGSAVIAAVALFASYIETIGGELGIRKVGTELFRDPATQINVADPKVFIGLLIGGGGALPLPAPALPAPGR